MDVQLPTLPEEPGPPLLWWNGNAWSADFAGEVCGLLSGSFNPLHVGHLQLQSISADLLGGPVIFELTAVNADKPPLTRAEVLRRCQQFGGQHVAVTSAATFVQKSRLFPGTTFVVGADTARRVVEPRFYGGSKSAMHQALGEITEHRCGFLVAARLWEQRIWTLEQLEVPVRHAGIFRAIPTDRFLLDVSSTELRSQPPVESPDHESARGL